MPSVYEILGLTKEKIASAIESGSHHVSTISPEIDIQHAECIDALINEAYRIQIRQYPPDHHPEAFQKIRNAYDKVKNLRARIDEQLFNLPDVDLPALVVADLPTSTHFRLTEQQFLQALKESL